MCIFLLCLGHPGCSFAPAVPNGRSTLAEFLGNICTVSAMHFLNDVCHCMFTGYLSMYVYAFTSNYTIHCYIRTYVYLCFL